jgi:hypothetical protein
MTTATDDMPHLLAIFMASPTHAAVSALVWSTGLVLQLALVVRLFTRRVAHSFPCFTALIAFYLLRSAVLFISYGRIDADNYNTLYEGLQLVELLAQAAVVVELTHHIMRDQGGWTLRRAVAPITLLITTSIATGIAVTQLPTRTPIPVDRTQLFFSILAVLIFAWAQSVRTASAIVRHITAGFAVYGIVSISANLGRTYAAIHKDPALYAKWSYAIAVTYLAVVAMWLVVLKRPRETASSL